MHYEMVGLRADNTQGWMAAVGVLYILDQMGSDAQMLWHNFHPVIHGVGKGQVVDILEKYLADGSDILDRLPVGVENEKPSLDLTAGRVNLRGVISQMLATVDRVKIDEALNKQWNNTDNITSLGWDAGAVKLAASVGGVLRYK